MLSEYDSALHFSEVERTRKCKYLNKRALITAILGSHRILMDVDSFSRVEL